MTRSKIVIIIAILMFASGIIYLYSAYSESSESQDSSAQIQSMFFATCGIVFLPIGIWMLKNRLHSRAPYVISSVISVFLIIFYVASRTTSLPVVGIQDDVGALDIASKAIQGTIVVLSGLVIPHLKKAQYPYARS